MNLIQVSSLQAQSLTASVGSKCEKGAYSSPVAVTLVETYSELASGALVTEAVVEAQGKKLRCKQVRKSCLARCANSIPPCDDKQFHGMQAHAA